MIGNLTYAYQKVGEEQKVFELNEIKMVLE
jgi:hypothetical protein